MKKMTKDKTSRDHIESCTCINDRLRGYFKVGIADDFILIRADFPMTEISPGDFSKLIVEMFRRNDEVRSHGK